MSFSPFDLPNGLSAKTLPPPHSLGNGLGYVIYEIHKNMQVPAESILVVILAALSLASQSHVYVMAPHGSIRPVMLYLLGLALTGDRKSPVLNLAERIFIELQHILNEKNRVEQAKYVSDMRIFHAAIKAFEAAMARNIRNNELEKNIELQARLGLYLQSEPPKPVNVRFIYNNTTMEGLTRGLQEHPSAGLFSAEGMKLLNERLLCNLSDINQIWDGCDLVIDRAETGNVTIKEPKLTIAQFEQPHIFRKSEDKFGQSARDSGLYARFLMMNIPSMQGFRSTNCVKSSWAHFPKFAARITAIAQEGVNAKEKLVYTLSLEANSLYEEFCGSVERELRPDGAYAEIRDFAAKMPEHTLRLAALLEHYGNNENREISSQMMNAAISLCIYFASQFFSLLVPEPQDKRDAKVLWQWFSDRAKFGECLMRKTKIQQCAPVPLRGNNARLTTALEVLLQSGRVRLEHQVNPQNPKYMTLYIRILQDMPTGF